MKRWLILAAISLLVGCGQPPAFPPAGDPGPVSLQFVSPDYYSRTLRPGPSGGATRTKPAKATQTSPEENDAPARPPTPSEPAPEEITDLLKRVEALDGRMQELQKKLSRPPRARRPAAPLSFEPIEP